MNYNYDLIIVGGGPAGSTMALYAARFGLKVLLVDKAKFPRDKICGDVIHSNCFPIFQELNLVESMEKAIHARAIRSIYYSEHQYLITPEAENGSGSVVCRRYIFDNYLFQAAKVCVDTHEEFKVENLLMEGEQVVGIQGKFANGESRQYTAKIVAGADGCSSVVAKKLGLPLHDSQHAAVATRAYYRNLSVNNNELEFYYLEDCVPGYFWIFPVDRETFNVGVIVFPDAKSSKTKLSSQKIHRQIESSELLKPKFVGANLVKNIRGWYLPLASKKTTIHGSGFILAGDAAGLIDPFLGHGIDRAMISGKIAAKTLATVCQGNDYSAEALQVYANEVWQHFGKMSQYAYQFRQQLKLPLLSSFKTRIETINDVCYQGEGQVISMKKSSEILV